MNIRETIVEDRKKRLRTCGHSQGLQLPSHRSEPLVPFCTPPILICEVKRKSPTRGTIAMELDPAELAKSYWIGGVRTFSVLTEEQYFGGSLQDLVRVKEAFPGATVLRKDFLLDEEDIEVSYRAGADAVLLIASVLDPREMEQLYRRSRKWGMSVLVEVHTEEDVGKLRSFRPEWVGINARNLQTFTTDLLHPLRIRKTIDWDANIVFESGVHTPQDGVFVGSAGFQGLLVGEALVRNPKLVPFLSAGFQSAYLKAVACPGGEGRKQGGFWDRVADTLGKKRPLVKVCGITNPADAEAAVNAGADLLGFVFAPSPRRANPLLLKELKGLDVLKVGVVVLEDPEDPHTVAELSAYVEGGFLDAIQVHGLVPEQPQPGLQRLLEKQVPFYLGWNPKNKQDLELSIQYRCGPRFLVDGAKLGLAGGTGIRVPAEILSLLQHQKVPVWLAGGLTPASIREVIETWNPELVDVSSGLETSPGKKDPDKVKTFFKELQRARSD